MKILTSLLKIIICIILMLNLAGCWSSRELDDLSIMIGISLDKAKEPGNVLLTAQIVKPGEIKQSSTQGGGSQGGSSTPYWNVKSSGSTVFDAVRNFTHSTGKKLYISHNQVYIFGSDLASEGVRKALDFFMRAHETRPTSLILVAAGTAEDVLDVKPNAEQFPALYISNLVKASSFTSDFMKVDLQEFTARLMSKTTSPIAPLIFINTQDGEKSVYISGMAVFKGDKMVGTLTPSESRGLLWTIGEVKSGVIDVDCPNSNGKVSFEINSAKTRLSPKLVNGQVIMQIEIKADLLLAEQTCTEDMLEVSAIEQLQQETAQVIQSDIQASYNQAKILNADVFGFGDKVHEKYPSAWKEMEDSWDEIFPEINLQFTIEPVVRRTGLITKPVAPLKEE